MDSPTAKAQVADALEQAAVALKRNIGASRKALQAVRQAQVGLVGIEIETITGEGSHSGNANISDG